MNARAIAGVIVAGLGIYVAHRIWHSGGNGSTS